MTNLPPSDLDRALARQKSYTGACILVVLLYCFFVLPGAIANYLYLVDASRAERIAGETLPGVAPLRAMWSMALFFGGFAVFVYVVFTVASWIERAL